MAVMTVQGLVDTEKLGIVSPHEHVFVDIRNQFTEFPDITRKTLADQRVNIRNLDVLSRDPYAVKDNLVLNDFELAEEEILEFKKAGGDAIVDATSRAIGRDPVALMRISRSTGIHIIAGCGYYTEDTHPPDMEQKKVEDIAGEMIEEITVGIDGTGIKAGVIGEIGTSAEVHAHERKVLVAAAHAQRETGVGIIVHAYPWEKRGLEIVEHLSKNGVKPEKVSINHVDVEIDLSYCLAVAETGAFVEFDNFGKEYFIDKRYRGYAGGVFARDIERVRALVELIDAGHTDRIFISCDVCLKTLLHRYGGWGYDHILTHIVPMMREEGITDDQIDTILRDNPKRFLDMDNQCNGG